VLKRFNACKLLGFSVLNGKIVYGEIFKISNILYKVKFIVSRSKFKTQGGED
jgi:hypothetical protein